MATSSPLSSRLYCHECGSTAIIADQHGYHVCRDCGLVCDDPVIDSNHSALNTDKAGRIIYQNAILCNVGSSLGTYYERNQQFRYRRLQKIQNMVSQSPKTTAFALFSQLRTRYDVCLSLQLLINEFNRVYPKLQKKSKCRGLPLLCSTIFLLVCKAQSIRIKLKSVLALYDLPKRDYFECVKRIHEIIPLGEKNLDNLASNIFTAVGRVHSALDLPSAIIPLSKYLIKKCRPYLGEKPEIIAGSAIGVAVKILHFPNAPSMFAISKVLKVTASTIYSRTNAFPVNKFRRHLQHVISNPEYDTLSSIQAYLTPKISSTYRKKMTN